MGIEPVIRMKAEGSGVVQIGSDRIVEWIVNAVKVFGQPGQSTAHLEIDPPGFPDEQLDIDKWINPEGMSELVRSQVHPDGVDPQNGISIPGFPILLTVGSDSERGFQSCADGRRCKGELVGVLEDESGVIGQTQAHTFPVLCPEGQGESQSHQEKNNINPGPSCHAPE